MNAAPLCRYIDHAVLKPDFSLEETDRFIRLGLTHEVRSVCVRPDAIARALALCRGTSTGVSTVLGFPFGYVPSCVKRTEAEAYCRLGVEEIDMVTNLGLIKSGRYDEAAGDIAAVSGVTRAAGVGLKVILETGALSEAEITRAVGCAADAGADFVKTSTGFYGSGATEEAVRAMLSASAGRVLVKASGGIRDAAAARFFLGLGCARLGVGCASTPDVCSAQQG